MQVQLSSSAIPEYTRNSAVLAIYGNQNNYLMVLLPVTHSGCRARTCDCCAP
jgi:hypothetical protein